MRLSSVFAFVVSGLVAAVGATGCDGGGTGTGGTGGSGGDGGSGGSTGGAPPACAPTCDANKGVKSDCVAIVDNAGAATYGLRMVQLTLEKPAALASPVVASLIESGVTMNLPDCNLSGEGTFSWLLQFDTATGMLKTGGAKPVADPTAGYCFVKEALGGIDVAPLEVAAKPDASGKFSVAMGGNVVVPIFLGDVSSFVLLPLKAAKLLNGTVSADQNCIGKYNADKLDPADSCEPSGDVTRYTDAATLDAHITLEDADSVIISSLGQSLCVLLTGDPGDGASPKKCSRDMDGKIVAKGDWCSTDDSAMSCQDAYKLGAQFAAAAVKINGDCQ